MRRLPGKNSLSNDTAFSQKNHPRDESAYGRSQADLQRFVTSFIIFTISHAAETKLQNR